MTKTEYGELGGNVWTENDSIDKGSVVNGTVDGSGQGRRDLYEKNCARAKGSLTLNGCATKEHIQALIKQDR